VPMLFSLAWFFNFFIGGVSGVFLSDVPSDVSTHGSFFVMAHFHYTIMGGLVFAFFAGIYYWVPKMFGVMLSETLGKIHFWTMFVAFNSTFFPLFALGLMGMPRRVVTYPSHLQALNVWVSVSAFVLGASMLVFLANVVYSLVFARKPAPANPWESKSLEWQTPTPVPRENFDRPPVIDSDPYDYGVPPVPAPPRPAEATG
jgi:cytochrome c oxidase subunit I